MNEWEREWSTAVLKANKNVESIIRESAKKLFSRIILDTPIDTGELKGDWVASLDSPNAQPTGNLDKIGYNTIAGVNKDVSTYKINNTIYLSNTRDYAEVIEYGSSSQTPAGMVRVNLTRWSQIVDSVANEYRNKV